ncbi:uncharacterized protein [Amphiura filiformis]|uniref:uncharacterized protein isoform X2 n=1 Tax=Amphiura filiformis TaxID=82378 RepID=UPI003B227D17
MNINRSFSGLRLLLFLILTSIATIHSLNITSVPPDESNPRCSYSSNQIPLNIMSIADTVTVEFTCEMAGGNPLPNLTWYKGATQELSTATSPNKFIYELSAYDNGIPFTCEASGPALQEIRSCVPGVTPLRVRPSVEISSSSSPVVENSSVIFTCEGSGLPYISQIYWSYNGKPVSNDSFPLSFKIVNNISDGFSSSSKLHLFSLQLDNNNDLVTCFVESPSFLSSQAIVTVSVIRVGTQTATPTQQTLSLTSVTNEQNMSPSQVPRAVIDLQSTIRLTSTPPDRRHKALLTGSTKPMTTRMYRTKPLTTRMYRTKPMTTRMYRTKLLTTRMYRTKPLTTRMYRAFMNKSLIWG